ncbi:MAG: amidohydrolase family protein, partial [Actinomycetota bacterium]|nr:amidohydrolase family protein [Actinomycetota bacterium]
RADVLDVHTHLGVDEDGSSLDLETLLAYLDLVDPAARACVFPLHDPDRHPAYRTPNDRVLEWARQSDGRLYPFCRLDPAEEPAAEAERCLALGARGIKLHPRAQSFGFGDGPAAAIFEVARDARVPILIHAGRGMPPMDPLAELALRFPEVPLVLAHAAIADQGMFATRLAGHPAVLYDTSCFSALDVVELFARVPAERIVFGSDPPYGRPIGGLFQTMRVAAYAGLDATERAAVAGGTVTALLGGQGLAPISPPRIGQVRPISGRLARVGAYLIMGFAAVMGGGRPPDVSRALPGIALARAAARDPDPGVVGPALARIDSLLAAAERLISEGGETAYLAFGLVMASGAIAATEPLGAS